MIDYGSRRASLGRVVLCATLLLSLAACGGGASESTANNTAPADTPSVPSASPPPDSTPAPPANHAPLIDGDPPITVKAGDAYSFTPSASDADHDALTFSITGKPAWLNFDPATGALNGKPASTDVGQTEDIEITVSDGKDDNSVGPFRITVTPADAPPAPTNNAPKITGTPATLVMATQSYIFLPVATDADNDKLTFSITNRPRWATFSTSTGQLSGTPARTDAATYSNIRISVNDGKTTAALAAFNITVQPAPNSAPTVSGTPATAAQVGTAYLFKPTASDVDKNTLTWKIENRPTWATFSTTTGQLSGTPSAAGTFAGIVISVSDGTLSASLPAFSIVVTAASTANRAPTISGSPAAAVNAGAAYSFTPSAADADGDGLTFSITNKPSWASFSTTTGQLTGTPAASDAGSTSGIVISVSDGKATASLTAFQITVNAAVGTGSATLSWTPPNTNSDGSLLTDLAGFRIYYGNSSSSLGNAITIADKTATSGTVGGLAKGTWYFAVRAYTAGGLESSASPVVSKTFN